MCERMACPHYEGINMMSHQADNDGNYCDPSRQTSSLYGPRALPVSGLAGRVPVMPGETLSCGVAVFIVTLPKGLSPEAAQVFKQEISASLGTIVRDAQMAIDSLAADELYEIGRAR